MWRLDEPKLHALQTTLIEELNLVFAPLTTSFSYSYAVIVVIGIASSRISLRISC